MVPGWDMETSSPKRLHDGWRYIWKTRSPWLLMKDDGTCGKLDSPYSCMKEDWCMKEEGTCVWCKKLDPLGSCMTQWFCFDYNTPSSFIWLNWIIRNVINFPNNMWHYERVIVFVPYVHSNLNIVIFLIYFYASGRWIIPITIKQDKFIFWVQLIVYQLVNMCNNAIKVVFTTICNCFYKYTIVYGFFPLCPCPSVKFIFFHKVCVSLNWDLNMTFI